MIRPAQILRVLYINLVLVRHGLDELIMATHLLRPIRFLIYLAPWYWLRGKREPRGVRIRRALEDLGPIFVKFGQILSTRRDLLPDDIAVELAGLQDRVAPFGGAAAKQIIERAYGKPVSELFAQFDETPLASASIAQVHTATLPDGRDVVVKVLRPNIEPVIRRDVGLMYYLAGLAERYWREARRLRPREVVAEFEKVIYDELDLVREAANAAQLRRNFEGSELLYVPEAFWPYARRNVIVMERINGIPISDVQGLLQQGIDLKTLAEHGVEIFYTQVFRHNFFHADMHPGNIFVSPEGQYIAVDFGIMGTLSPDDQRYLAENFLAFFNRDYRRVAELHLESGWVPADTRVDEFESAIRTVCEPNFNRPLKDISFGQVLLRLFQTARRFNMEVQPQLVLLQKTLLNIEGLGRQLYPDLDLWKTAKPYLERWMSEQIGARAFVRRLQTNLPIWSEKVPELPALLHRFLSNSIDTGTPGQGNARDLQQELRREIRRGTQRVIATLVGVSLLVGASINLAVERSTGTAWTELSPAVWLLALAGVVVVGFAWLRR